MCADVEVHDENFVKIAREMLTNFASKYLCVCADYPLPGVLIRLMLDLVWHEHVWLIFLEQMLSGMSLENSARWQFGRDSKEKRTLMRINTWNLLEKIIKINAHERRIFLKLTNNTKERNIDFQRQQIQNNSVCYLFFSLFCRREYWEKICLYWQIGERKRLMSKVNEKCLFIANFDLTPATTWFSRFWFIGRIRIGEYHIRTYE